MKSGLLSLIVLVTLSTHASADLIGTDITATAFGDFADVSLDPVGLVGPVNAEGTEDFEVTIFASVGVLSVDVFDDGIDITNPDGDVGELGFSFTAGVTFSGLDWGGTGSLADVEITSFNVGLELPGPDPTISFAGADATEFTLNLTGVLWSSSSFINIALTPQHAAAVPEPASLLLLGTGLFGLAAYRRRRA